MRERVIEVLCNVNEAIRDNLEADLLATGLVDSFEIVNLVVELEDEFEIEIDPELVVPENFKTVNAIINLVKDIVNE